MIDPEGRNLRAITQMVGTLVFNEGSTLEQTLLTIVVPIRAFKGGLWLDFTLLTRDVTIRVKHQIDGANYRTFQTDLWLFGVDDVGVYISSLAAYRNIQLSLQCAGGGGNVNIPYAVV